MTLRASTTSLIPGRLVAGNRGLGVRGSAVPATGTNGPGFLYNDLALPAEANKEVRGLILTRQGDYPGAEAALQKALALDPDNYDATLNLAALFGRTRDPRRTAQEARLQALVARREIRAQEFLRLVEAVP